MSSIVFSVTLGTSLCMLLGLLPQLWLVPPSHTRKRCDYRVASNAYMYFIVPYERTDKHVKNSLYIYNLEMCQSSFRFFPMSFFPTQRAFALCLFP